MQFEADPKIFSETVSLVAKNTASYSTIPVLTGVKLEVGEDGLAVTGGDENLIVRVSVPNDQEKIRIEEAGSIVVPAKHFAGIVKKLPPEPVKVMMDSRTIKLKSGSVEISLNGMEAEEYPRLPIKGSGNWTIPTGKLKELIRHTAFATARTESRPILTGALIKMAEGRLKMVATDSFRLSQCSVETGDGAEFQAVVPGKGLAEIRQMLVDGESVSLHMGNSHMVWETGNKTVFTRLLDGTYPDTDRLIPSDYRTRVRVDGKTLLSALERVDLLAAEANHTVKLEITKEALFLSSYQTELGMAGEEICFESMEGEGITIHFNGRFVIEALRAIGEGLVEIGLNGTLVPFAIRPVDQEDHLHLIVPVRP
jgi:DNA polymerase-3 subunit beta